MTSVPFSEKSSWLVSHGTESVARGGPTTRVGQIRQEVLRRGGSIASTSNIEDLLEEQVDPGLIHVFNSWPLKSALRALSLARRSGAPVVYSPIMLNLADRTFYDTAVKQVLRDSTHDRQVEDGTRLIAELASTWRTGSDTPPHQGETQHFDYIRRQIALADQVICLSEYEHQLLSAIGAKPAQTTIVHNGVDTQSMAAGDKDRFQKAFGLSDFFLMVGRIEPRKNQALAAFALRELDVPVVCIGHIGDADYFAQLKRWAGPKLVHIERIDDRQMLAAAYKAARCLLLPSWCEGAPLVALEAGAAGTPLILSSTSSEKEYFGDWAGYVHPTDLLAIKELAARQVNSPDTEERRKARSAFTCEHYSIERHVDSTLDVYANTSRRPSDTNAHQIFLDATHLAHQIRNNAALTGVPRVENDLGKAILEDKPETGVIVWSSESRGYTRMSEANFGKQAMGVLAAAPAEPKAGFDILATSAEIRISPVSQGKLTLVPECGPGPARRALTVFKYGLNALPGPLHRPALGILRKIRPGFSPVVLPEHSLLMRARISPSRTMRSEGALGQVRISYRLQPEAQKTFLNLPVGARLILLGQPWISNDRYLEDLSEYVARYDLQLFSHIPDILYATRPDTFDSETANQFTDRLKRILQITDTVITISEQSEREIKAFAETQGLERAVCRILPGCPSLPNPSAPHQLRQDLSRPYVLYVGSMSERKQHEFISEAWRQARASSEQVQKATLVFAGSPLPGFERYANSDFLAELEADGILVLSGCSNETVSALYRNADFTVYPSAAEGWGLPPVESLTVGKPCLVSAELPVAQELQTEGFRRLPARDLSAWTKALQDWLEDPKALGAATRVAEAFTPPDWKAAARIIFASEG